MSDIDNLIRYVVGFAWRNKARNHDPRVLPGEGPFNDIDICESHLIPPNSDSGYCYDEFQQQLSHEMLPEKRLCMAMIVRAILDLFSEEASAVLEGQRSSLEWLCYRSRYDVFVPKDASDDDCELAGSYVLYSFSYCCQALDIPTNDVREAILKAYRSRC